MNQSTPDARPRVLRPLRLLLIDDNPHDRDLVMRALRHHFGSVTVVPARDAAELEHVVAYGQFDAAIVDYELRWTTGIEALREIKRVHRDCPVVMFTASGNTEVAVAAMREGLDDYVTKTAKHYARLPYALESCLDRAHHQRELAQARVDRSRLAEQITVGQQRLQFALESAGLVAWDIEAATGQLHLSSNAAQIFGARWTTVSQAVTAADAADVTKAKAAYDSALETGDAFTCELHMARSPDQREILLEVRGQPIRAANGAVAAVAGVARDITEHRRAEEALRLADRRKDAFLAILAHELRNPLAPIRYATRLLEPGVPPQMAADAKKMIDRQLAHMARLLDDLLDVSRVTRGVLEIRRERLDLRDVIESAVAAVQPLAEAARQELTVRMPAEPLAVTGDAVRLAQIVGNLLHNATKYTPAGGHITLAALPGTDEVSISVKDDGVGIAAEAITTIFELFVQLDPTGTRAVGGLGIGLSLARDLVKLHGGEIEARSAGRGLGSEFVVRLPRAREAQALTEAIAAPEKVTAIGAAAVRVLIVDDNTDAATSLSYVLTLAGYRVEVAHDGSQALEIAAQLHPNVVLLDIGLPGMSGHEVARHLRADPWAGDLQLIAVTGWGQESDRAKSLAAGFDEHLTKPIDPEILLQRISHAALGASSPPGLKSPAKKGGPEAD